MSGGIQDFYANKTILITGSTGFLGSYLVEKLLRSCTDVKKMYLLIRPKSGKTGQDRLHEFLENPVYTDIRKTNPIALNKLVALAGDLELPKLGLSDQDLEKIKRDVNCIFHLGATVRFTEELRRAILININGTSSLIEISKQIQNLESFVHVSTAFSQCFNDVTKETFYTSTGDGDTLINMANTTNNQKFNDMTDIILGKWHNTYIFTKHVAENVIWKNRKNLPIAIVRPSIIFPPYNEPKSYWTSSLESISLIFVALNLGILHAMYCNPNNNFDLVPADFVVNSIIAAGWRIGSRKMKEPPAPIFNYVSCQQNPITWGRQEEFLKKNDAIMPSNRKISHRIVLYCTNRFLLRMMDLLFLPWLYLINLKSYFYGKTPTYSSLKFYQKVSILMNVAKPFTGNEWIIEDNNTQFLWNSLDKEDKEIFNFDIKSLDWEKFYNNYSQGVRCHILKDTSTIEEARRKAHALKILFYILILTYILVFLFVLYECFVIFVI